MTSITVTKKNKSAGFNLTPTIYIMGVIALLLTMYIGYRISISNRKLFSVGLVALFAGLFFESFRVSGKWKTVVHAFILAYLISLSNFLPGKNEHNYNFEDHVGSWPYVFIIIFALTFAIFYKNKVTAKLTEGITLLQSISFLYWAIDYGFINFHNWFSIILISIAFIFSAFSILNALSYIPLTKTRRLVLSIWSTTIMFVFAIDNIISVFGSNNIANSKYLSQNLYIGLQYFLLGVSAIYIVQNYILLANFLPSKNGHYKKDLQENIQNHIERYSDKQIFIGDSLFCILYSTIIYGLNYEYRVLPRNTMIWLVFFSFSLIVYITDVINRQKTIAKISIDVASADDKASYEH